ncbi:hypothetical protein APHAL10511_003946 [Amanita phalloides]|nr:hypothetical protein APHAL10511_003946 [Amanita phalloides]
MLETPSRIWRRIEAIENRDMPSLPSLPPFEDSGDNLESSDALSASDGESNDVGTAVHSTPAANSYAASTFRAASSTSSTARFARSITSRSAKSSTGPSGAKSPRAVASRKSSLDDFDVSRIPSLPKIHIDGIHRSTDTDSDIDVDDGQHDVYLPEPENGYEDEDLSISDALQSVSRSSSPAYTYGKEKTPVKSYDYSLSLKSEPKPSPIEKFRNVAVRRPPSRTRTPSLTHTLTSTSSSSTNDTPPSVHASRSGTASPIPGSSIPLPLSRVASESPVVVGPHAREDLSVTDEEQRFMSQSMQMQSMDITDVQISPPQLGYPSDQESNNEGQYSTTDTEEKLPTDVTDEEGFGSQNDAASADDREPTFSSDAEQTAYGGYPGYDNRATFDRVARQSPGPSAAQSPAQSLPFTPTPAFPRPRSRLNAPADSDDLETPRPPGNQCQQAGAEDEEIPEEQEEGAGQEIYEPQAKQVRIVDDDLVTPHSRRRSFLLSVINSTARPRLKYSIPHPRDVMATPLSVAESSVAPTPVANARTAFAGFTPRPRLPSGSNAGRSAPQSAPSASQTLPATQLSGGNLGSARVQWATPGPGGLISPQVAADSASFISTASSHDLTTHHRVNTSFDPAMGFGIPGQGVGRFNASKLNTYLHGLNRRLQEENEILMEKLRRAQGEKEGSAEDKTHQSPSGAFSSASRRSSAGRRASGGTVLDDVREDVTAEGWLEEKARLEEEVVRVSEENDELERNLETERKERERDKQRWKDRIAELEQGVEGVVKDLEQKLGESDARAKKAEEERDRDVKDLLHKLDEAQSEQTVVLDRAKRAAANQITTLESDLGTAKQQLEKALSAEREAHQRSDRLETAVQKAQDVAQHLEDVLQDTEDKMVHDQGVIAELSGRIGSLERELKREKGRQVDPSRDLPNELDIQALEEELDSANREIARLNTVLNQSPARKAVDKAKDMRIEVLEREKEELLERNKALRMTMNEMNASSKVINSSGISPIHRHVLSMSIRAPRTPGGPLKELSWLNTPSDPSVSPFVVEISRLQRELDRANESIDDKLDKLQDAGLGVVGLTRKLEDARARITTLEDEISRLSRREDHLIHRMERIRCHKCHIKIDARAVAYADESSEGTFKPEAPTRTSEVLHAELRSVNSELENLKKQWEDEKRQLVGEKAALKDAAERLDAQVKKAREEAKRAFESGRAGDKARVTVEGELENAKRVIADLEDKLKGERANLRALTTEQDKLQRDKGEVLSQLQRTESDMEGVRQQLLKMKQENHDLEKELRVNATAEQKARILEARVAENFETIEHLRQERSLLATDHKQLQRRFTELTEQANQLRSKYSVSSTSHEKRRHRLDLYRLEIEDLRRDVSEQADELHRAEREKKRIATEKEDVAKTVASLEADLRRVKKSAEAFGRDLKQLRAEKEDMEESHKHELARLERSKKQAHAQSRLLNEQLESHKDAVHRAQEQLRDHSCAADETQLAALKLRHNKECKGLVVQVRYLKTKFTRESSLRTNLCYQKQYLLVLLSRYEKSEQTIFASIARIGFPVSPPPAHKKLRSFRSLAVAALFSVRASRAAKAWREQCSAKEAVAVALQEVRQRRAARTVNPY